MCLPLPSPPRSSTYRDTQLIHMAPPALRVAHLMDELLEWLATTDLHPLVASAFVAFMLSAVNAALIEGLNPSFSLSDNVSEEMSEKIISCSEAERAVLNLLNIRPDLSAKALANELAVSARTVERYLQSLQQKGKLLRVGAKKGGYWQVKSL